MLAVATFGLGCPSDEEDETGTTTDASSSTSASGSTTQSATTTTGEGTTQSPTTDATQTGTTTEAESSSTSSVSETTTGTDASSSGTPCEPGTADCECDEGACGGGLECIEGLCLDPKGCQGERDDEEPNDSEATAVSLPAAECGSLYETLGSADLGDEDWFTFQTVDLGEDDCPQSDGTIAIVTADEDLEVCIFFDCDAGAATVNCPTDEEETSPDGWPGCCGTASVEPAHFCTGIDNNGTASVRVGGVETQMCIDYELAYRFL